MLGDGSQRPDHHHYRGVLFFSYTFQVCVRPDWKCRGCVVMVVMITAAAAGCIVMTLTAGDAEDA